MNAGKTSRKAIGLLLAVFVLGIALGAVGNHLWEARVEASHHHGIIEQLKRELQLTPQQTKQFDKIINDDRTKFRALDAQRHAEWDAKYDQVREQGRTSIRAILTPEQRAKFDAFLKHLDEERQRGQQGH